MDNLEINETRKTALEQANELGVTEAFLFNLVDEFYDRVRKDDVLGPIFIEAVSDWPEHMDRMKKFWASICLGAGTYSGRPMPVHMALSGIQPWHFCSWLGLFTETLLDIAPSREAARYVLERADRIGNNLRSGIFQKQPEHVC